MNHHAIFNNVGIEPITYPYYDPATVGLDFKGYKASLEGAEDGSVFLIHGCAHNVSGPVCLQTPFCARQDADATLLVFSARIAAHGSRPYC